MSSCLESTAVAKYSSNPERTGPLFEYTSGEWTKRVFLVAHLRANLSCKFLMSPSVSFERDTFERRLLLLLKGQMSRPTDARLACCITLGAPFWWRGRPLGAATIKLSCDFRTINTYNKRGRKWPPRYCFFPVVLKRGRERGQSVNCDALMPPWKVTKPWNIGSIFFPLRLSSYALIDGRAQPVGSTHDTSF